MNVSDWYSGLTRRERNLVAMASALAAVLLLYLGLVLPVQTLYGKGMQRLEQKTADLAWMRSVAPQVQAAAARTPRAGASDESLVVLVDRTAREAGLGGALRGQSPDGEQGQRLRFEGVSFDALVAWLASLEEQHGVRIEAANVDPGAAAGLVNASVTVRAPGAASPGATSS
jgi:type II secretory pathway component PulM